MTTPAAVEGWHIIPTDTVIGRLFFLQRADALPVMAAADPGTAIRFHAVVTLQQVNALTCATTLGRHHHEGSN